MFLIKSFLYIFEFGIVNYYLLNKLDKFITNLKKYV